MAYTLEQRQPLTVEHWDAIIDVMREHGITGLNANGQMTAEALKCVSKLNHAKHGQSTEA